MTHLRFDTLIVEARNNPPMTVAVVDAADKITLESAKLLLDQGIMRPVLVGNEKKIRALMKDIGMTEETPIVSAGSDEQAAREGVRLVEEGTAQSLMKGHVHTDIFLHPVLEQLRKGVRVSHVFVAELPAYRKLLFITDAAINITPDLATKESILQNAIDMVHALGHPVPDCAVLSAVEIVSPNIPSTLDAACLAKMADRGQITGARVDGPLPFDSAISAEAARTKGIRSSVAGEVDILLVPDMISGNILAKNLEYLAGATLAGIVLGARVPVILTSRSDPPRSRFLSGCLASVLWHTLHSDSPR